MASSIPSATLCSVFVPVCCSGAMLIYAFEEVVSSFGSGGLGNLGVEEGTVISAIWLLSFMLLGLELTCALKLEAGTT